MCNGSSLYCDSIEGSGGGGGGGFFIVLSSWSLFITAMEEGVSR